MGAMSDFWNNVVAPAGASLAKSADSEVAALQKAGSAIGAAASADATGAERSFEQGTVHVAAGLAEATGLGGQLDKFAGGDGTNQDLGARVDQFDQAGAKARQDASAADKKAVDALGDAVPGSPKDVLDATVAPPAGGDTTAQDPAQGDAGDAPAQAPPPDGAGTTDQPPSGGGGDQG
jgi:hypothetical protein